MSLGLRLLGEEVFKLADPKTPRRYGNLRRDKVLQVLGLTAILRWDKKYAAAQEDIQHRNYTTPGTGPHYAENAVKQALTRADRIFKQAQRAL